MIGPDTRGRDRSRPTASPLQARLWQDGLAHRPAPPKRNHRLKQNNPNTKPRPSSKRNRPPKSVAVEDLEIGGAAIKAGEGVIALNQAANRDGEAFDGAGEGAGSLSANQAAGWGGPGTARVARALPRWREALGRGGASQMAVARRAAAETTNAPQINPPNSPPKSRASSTSSATPRRQTWPTATGPTVGGRLLLSACARRAAAFSAASAQQGRFQATSHAQPKPRNLPGG